SGHPVREKQHWTAGAFLARSMLRALYRIMIRGCKRGINLMKKVVCGLLAAVCVAPATAQEFMLSGGISMFDDGDIQLDSITTQGTVYFTPNFGVEGEFS